MPDSNVKRGTEYEKFVQQVYQVLNSQSDLSDVKVQQNVFLDGNSRRHQIDVYWEFCKAGIEYKVAVECKDYKRAVSAEKIDAFATVLNDLGNIKGVFVSKNGFQSGAIQDAKRYGIQLMEIRDPREEDFENKVANVILNLDVISIKVRNIKFNLDNEWKEKHTTNGLCEKLMNQKLKIESDNRCYSLNEVIDKLPKGVKGKLLKHTFDFPKGWLITEDGTRCLINSIEFTYVTELSKQKIYIGFKQAVKAVVKNIITGEMQLIKVRDMMNM